VQAFAKSDLLYVSGWVRSWVLVYCLQVITCLVEICILEYEIVCNCMINHFLLLLTLLLVWFVMCVVLLLVWFVMCVVLISLRWSSIYWCEQMRELLVINREMMIPLLKPLQDDFRFFEFHLGLWPMYHLIFKY